MTKTMTTRTESAKTPAPPPADPFTSFRHEMNRLFDDYFTGFGRHMPSFRDLTPGWLGRGDGAVVPAVDIAEDDKQITVTAELPGLEEDDVEVTLRDDMLSIKGEKKSEREEKKENYFLSERHYGSFQRSFRLSEDANPDKIAASFDKGVLKVVIPKKAESRKAARKIKIGK